MQAYTHVTVIDATGAPPRPDQTVLVDNGVIAVVGPCSQVPVPETATVTDLTGKHVVPGPADMHVHSDATGADDELFPALYIANGVTTVREMWGKPQLHERRRRTEAGEVLGPRSTASAVAAAG